MSVPHTRTRQTKRVIRTYGKLKFRVHWEYEFDWARRLVTRALEKRDYVGKYEKCTLILSNVRKNLYYECKTTCFIWVLKIFWNVNIAVIFLLFPRYISVNYLCFFFVLFHFSFQPNVVVNKKFISFFFHEIYPLWSNRHKLYTKKWNIFLCKNCHSYGQQQRNRSKLVESS